MHTTCVPVVVAQSISSGMLKQRKRIQESSQHMPIATVRLDDDQAAWVESQTTRYRKKADVIRDLIDTARQGVDVTAKLPAYRVGAGAREVERVPAVQAVMPDQPATQPHLQTAVQEGAVEFALELEPEKKSKTGIKVPKSQKPRAKKTKGSPEFETFWGMYQSAPMKANKQAKPQAWEVWQQLVPDEISADDLTRAILAAIEDMESRQRAGEFCSCLPDCFRWLRDDCYSVFLESHTPKQAKPSWML